MDVKGKILVVDDDAISRIVIEKHLKKKGFEVISADSAIKGGQLLKTNDVFLVISDINMPQVNGIEFLLWIKEFKPNCFVILMTGDETKDLEVFASKKGAVNFFRKPVDIKKLDDFLDFKIAKKKFKSSITDITLLDFIKMSILLGKKKLTLVSDPLTSRVGKIYIQDCKIIHAEIENLYGENAFYEILRIKKGAFHEGDWHEPHEFTIERPVQDLIYNAESIIHEIMENAEPSELETFNKNKILVVDDDPTTCSIIEKYLSIKDFQVKTAESGFQGIELLKKDFFNLVITDLNMPGMGGIEFFLWIKLNRPSTRVVIMTAFGSDYIKDFVKQSGAISYFDKPVNLKELENLIINLSAEGVSGDIQDIDLIDFIQLLQVSGEQKLIKVFDPIEQKEGKIFISSGNVIHAEIDNLTGERAFQEIVNMETGIFSEGEWYVPPQFSLNDPISKLLQHKDKNVSLKNQEQIVHKAFFPQEQVSNNQPKEDSHEMVRYVNPFIEKSEFFQKDFLDKLQVETDPLKAFTIYESGLALEISLGKTNKKDAILNMTRYSNSPVIDKMNSQMLLFDDISLTIIFNEFGIAEEMNFGLTYKGKTSMGVGIGDSLEKTIQIYGKPQICTIKGAVWDNMAFFSQSGKEITTIRMRSKNIFEPAVTQQKILQQKVLPEEIKALKALIAASVKALPEPEEPEVKHYSTTVDDELYVIDEEYNSALGIKIGYTTRDQVRDIMKELRYVINQNKSSHKNFVYDDITLSVIFDDKGIVEEMNFGFLYMGKTKKGVAIGDYMEHVLKIYGTPMLQSGYSYNWGNFSIFTNDVNAIDAFRLKMPNQ